MILTMMQSKWRMPAGAASSALLLALCIQRTVSFQTQSSLAIPTRLHPQTSPITRAAANIPLFASSSNDVDDDNNTKETKNDNGPDLLQPYLPAIDPKYSVKGPIGEGKFTISRSGPPTAAELSNEQMLQIVKIQCSDLEVNTLVWKCLGYRFHEETWSPTEVFPKWKERFPDPPDFIGMQRVYSREVDVPSLRSNQALVRSVPQDNKQSLKTHLKPLGWTGYQYKELTPNKTRRAQCANWLIFYREELFGYTVEELKERRRLKKEAETVEAKRLEEEEGEKSDEWKLPVKEVY